MTSRNRWHSILALAIVGCMLALPVSVFANKGKDHFAQGMKYEQAQQWEKAAQEFTLAMAADPSNVDYQLHYRRSVFNASQAFMQQGRSLAEQRDYVGAYNAFRQAFGYDPVNQLAVSEMERMLRLEQVKQGLIVSNPSTTNDASAKTDDALGGGTPSQPPTRAQEPEIQTKPEVQRTINFNGVDIKNVIKQLALDLNLNVMFDRQSFAQPRPVDLNLQKVTTAKALDLLFLQENLFFQKLDKRTILVADQSRRPQYQQLVVRTFFIANSDPDKIKLLIGQALPASVGRPQPIVVSDKDTNSLTVRDTAENVKLIGELLESLDKDRAEVVMDVNIYEVSKNDMLQFGNQIGTTVDTGIGGSPGFSLLTDNGVVNGAAGAGVNLGALVGGVPTALAAALVIPPSVLRAFRSMDNTKLIASTQVHAFNGEESQARIGQRVPVQTAQAYPFGVQTGTPIPGTGAFPSGGFPVINYEPTGLTLKFTPQVFPNLDVQVKMNIEQKDVLGASTLTPTFTERTMTGTARVQNNKTMMLASVSTDIEARGRKGIAFIGGLPLIGRLFTSPTRDLRQVDIVISVTPRVLRAPNVTPRDEEMRPSGTLQSPTTGSLAEMIRDADREDQIAAARAIPRNTAVQLPDAAVEVAKGVNSTQTVAQNTAPQNTAAPAPVNPATAPATQPNTHPTTQPTTTQLATQTPAATTAQAAPAPAPVKPPVENATAANTQVEELPAYVPAPKSLISDRAAEQVATVNPGGAINQNAVMTSMPAATNASLDIKSVDAKLGANRVAHLTLLKDNDVMKIGEKRRYAVQLDSDVPLSLALVALKFDPKVVKVNSVTAGSLVLPTDNAPLFTPSIDGKGLCMISISALNKGSFKGSGPLLLIDLEAVGTGDAALTFVRDTLHLVATDARDVVSEIVQGTATVKE